MEIKADPQWWKSLFDGIYLLTDARSVRDEEITRLEVNIICHLLPLREDHWILDLCGGQGRHSLELTRRGYRRCTVLDYSGRLLKYGKALATPRGLPVAFVQGDARNLGLASGAFHHVIVMGNSLGYSPDPEDDGLILSEAHRVLRGGGWLLIDVADGTKVRASFNPNVWHEIGPDIVVCRQRRMNHDSITTREMVISKKKGLIRDSAYSIRLYHPQALATLLEKVGFTHVRVYPSFSPHKDKEDYGFMNHRVIITAQKS